MSDNAYDRHSYAGAAPDTTLSSSISDTDLTVTCADLTGWPDGTGGNFVVIFEPGKTAEEKCLASARVGNVLTLVSRGMEGAPASHTASTTTVRHGFSARDANEANYAVHQTVGQVSAKGSIIVGSAAHTLVELPIGSTGQALVVSGGTAAWGKPTLAESDVTGLVNALAGKLATPATAIAKGSLLVGTGANVADSVAVGADGTVWTADSTATAGGSWQIPSAGGLLAHTDYTGTALTVSGIASLVALSTASVTVSFTAPPSGKVLLRACAELDSSGSSGTAPYYWGWFTHNTTTQVGRSQRSADVNNPGHGYVAISQVVSGLTPGAAYQLDLAARQPNGATNTASDITLEVWAAA